MKNIYSQLMGEENALCVPLIEPDLLQGLPLYAANLAGLDEESKFPTIVLDLEQIQILDYTSVSNVSERQKTIINAKLKKIPSAPDELAFLALKSLYTYVWCEIKNKEEFEIAVKTESALNYVLSEQALKMAPELMYQDAKLPYWIRLSYLRVMSKVPESIICEGKLDTVACYPIKSLFFNAKSSTFKNDTSPIIGFNYALEPILKLLNRLFIHFYSSQHLAGKTRIERAWKELLPIVQYLNGTATAFELTPNSVLFSVEDAKLAQDISADQVDFIMLHELGHILYGHPFKLDELKRDGNEIEAMYELELEADGFFHQVYNKWLLQEGDKSLDSKLGEYANLIEGGQLLFIYMDFLEKAKSKVASFGTIKVAPSLSDTHPTANQRLSHLNTLVGITSKSNRIIYAMELFDDILNYMDSSYEDELLSKEYHLHKEVREGTKT
jgi:hypothetical protein